MNNKKIAIGGIILAVVVLLIAVSIPQNEDEVEEDLLGIKYDIKGNETSLKYDTENPVVAMYVKDYGSIVIELYPDIAPNTVNSFISLVKNKYYDDNTFHRLDPGFVLQGGDPTGTGQGGPGYTIEGEFSENGFENNLSHEKWVVSMGRKANDNNSAGGQFFICLDNHSELDGMYASFGRVIDGFDNIKKMTEDGIVENEVTGKLRTNFTIKKTLIDLHGKEYDDVIKVN